MRGLLLAVAVAGCATPSSAIIGSGESLLAAGKTFEAVAGSMHSLCAVQRIDARTCADWAVFGQEFKTAYTLAVAGWNLSTTGLDGGAYDVGALLGQLAGFASLIADTINRGTP